MNGREGTGRVNLFFIHRNFLIERTSVGQKKVEQKLNTDSYTQCKKTLTRTNSVVLKEQWNKGHITYEQKYIKIERVWKYYN